MSFMNFDKQNLKLGFFVRVDLVMVRIYSNDTARQKPRVVSEILLMVNAFHCITFYSLKHNKWYLERMITTNHHDEWNEKKP